MMPERCRDSGGRRPLRARLGLVLVGALFSLLVLGATQAFAQVDRCANCHLANSEDGLSGHLQDYQASAHARAGVDCAACHRGDSSTFDRQRAHRGVLPPSDPESAVHPANIPVTCGACHSALFVAFSESPHFEALRAGQRVPTCVSCHGEAGSHRTIRVGATCQKCHTNQSDNDAAMLALAGQLQTRFLDLAKTRRKVENKIHRVDDPALVHELEGGYLQAEDAWHRALEAGHALDIEGLAQGVEDTESVLDQLLVWMRGRRP